MDNRRIYRIVFVISLMVLLLGGGQARADVILTYDDFATSSGGSFDPTKWNPVDNTSGFLSVIPEPGESNNVLHISGSGGSSYPGGFLQTASSFPGSFGAGINYANFSYTGPPPLPGDSKNPSVSIMIGDGNFATGDYFVVSRAYHPVGGNVIGWRRYEDGVKINPDSGWIPFEADFGGLAVSYQNNGGVREVTLGYFVDSNPVTWGGDGTFHPLRDPFVKTFDNGPYLRISANGGSQTGSTLTADVGGLYYTEISSVPLPSAWMLFAPALAGLVAVRRRFQK